MNQYEAYDPSDIKLMLYEPWEISDRPYMLHAAYALSCLYETVAPMDDDEEPGEDDPRNSIWGETVPQKIIDRLAQEIQESFNDAATNYKPIDIWGKSYSIRKVNAFDRTRLHKIFRFPLKNGEYTIVKEGILDLRGVVPDVLQKYEVSREEIQANIAHLRKIIKLAEDDENDGWDKLTDMEMAVYCWAQYYNKCQNENLWEFQRQYKDYLYVSEDEIKKCLNDKAVFRQRPQGMYTFAAHKVQEWNTDNKQKSYVYSISKEEADDYWYNTALQSTFKPMDLK